MKPTRWAMASALALAVGLASRLLPAAGAAPLTDGVQQGQYRQQQIKSLTQRATAEMGAIIAEYQANGLGDSADVQVLTSIQSVLDKLSQEQMERVLSLLTTARHETDPGRARKTISSAVSDQTDISFQLRQVLLEYQRQHDLAAVALHFNQLAERQHANLKLLRRYDRLARGATLFTLNEVQREYLQTQLTEQERIGQEVEQQLGRLDEIAQDVDDVTKHRLAQVRDRAADQHLTETLNAAADELASSHIGLSIAHERAARNALRDLARLAAPPEDALNVLRSAGERINRLIQQQNAVIAASSATAPDTQPDSPSLIEEQQADIVDDTDDVCQDILDIAAGAAQDLDNAVFKMQKGRQLLLDGDRERGVPQASAARMDLEAAAAKIATTVGRMERLAVAQELVEQASALKEVVAALRQDQEKLLADLDAKTGADAQAAFARRQASLARSAESLRPFAELVSLQVASLVNQAAQSMDQAATSLGTQLNPANARLRQQAAITALKQAEDLLDSNIRQMIAAKQEVSELEDVRARLVQAILAQQNLVVDIALRSVASTRPAATAPAVAASQAVAESQPSAVPAATQSASSTSLASAGALASQPAPTTLPAAPASLAGEESRIGRDVVEIRRLLGTKVPPAATAVDQALDELAKTQKRLDALDFPASRTPAREALSNLEAAQTALDIRLDDLHRLLGQPDDSVEQLDRLMASISQAQSDLNNDPDPLRDAVVALRDQQRQLAAELRHRSPNDPRARRTEELLQKSAERLHHGQLLDAMRQMDEALDVMHQMDSAPAENAVATADLTRRLEAARESLLPLLQQAEAAKPPATEPAEPNDEPPPPPPVNLDPPGAPTLRRLRQVASDLTRARTDDHGAMPPAAEQALVRAEQELTTAAAEAAAGNETAARAARHRALEALSMAEKSTKNSSNQKNSPSKPNPQQPKQEQPKQGNKKQDKPDPNKPGEKKEQKDPPDGRGVAPAGARPAGAGDFLSLPPRDRAAIEQSRTDRYPQEYAPLIEQYFKSLSEEEE